MITNSLHIVIAGDQTTVFDSRSDFFKYAISAIIISICSF